ncbi:MAG: ABC transporter permease [Parasporobacterium sp.]|nr:ABC transporter permease [Parasporobacterium sp.]
MHERTPLIRLARRDDISKVNTWLIRLAALVVAIILGGLIFLIADANPFEAYGTMISGSLGKVSGLRMTAKIAVPLLTVALALAPCFKMRYWNIGAEGQITIGAMCASFFAINCKDWPAPVLLIVMGVAAFIGGAIWSIIPAIFKAKWGTNETLFTLMLNYIAIGIVAYLQGGPWEGKPGSQIIPLFSSNAVLPKIGGVHIGWIIALLITVFMFVYMKFTKHGYEIAVMGESENTARYAGMNVTKVTVRTAALSGAIAGVAGFMICSGADMTLYSDIAGGVGFTAITVCWLAQLNPFAMIVISVILAILTKGASSVQTALSVPSSISGIITGILLLAMLGCEFFINYKMIFRSKSDHHKEVK